MKRVSSTSPHTNDATMRRFEVHYRDDDLPHGAHRVEPTGSPHRLAWPNICPNCGAPASEGIRVRKVFRRLSGGLDGGEGGWDYVIRSATIPFCAACAERHRQATPPLTPVALVFSALRSPVMIAVVGATSVAVMLIPKVIEERGDWRVLAVFGVLVMIALWSLIAAWWTTRVYRIAPLSEIARACNFSDNLSNLVVGERHVYAIHIGGRGRKMMNVRKQITEWARRCGNGLRAVASIFCLPVLALAISLVASRPAASQNLVRLEPIGGPGGNYFEYICGPGRVLVGVRGYTGVWIDSLQAVCAKADFTTGVYFGSHVRAEGPIFGGNQPLTSSATCPATTAIAGWGVVNNKDKPFLGYIGLSCTNIDRASRVSGDPEMRGTGRLASDPDSIIHVSLWPPWISPAWSKSEASRLYQRCPTGMLAVGIRGRAGRFLDALGLICGPRPEPPETGREVSFQSFNYPDRYIRHKGWLGYIEPIPDDLGKKDATFKIVPGLAGRCSSFESHNYPDHFLRHQGSRLKLSKRSDDPLFREDSTFCIERGLAGSGSSFVSVNFPHFIRHRNSELWLNEYHPSDLFGKDATFKITEPAYAGRSIGKLKIGESANAGRRVGKARLGGSRSETVGIPTEPSQPPIPTPAPEPVPPFIIASLAVGVNAAGQPQRTATLTWDGGQAHPYAEVWVKVDDADETFIVEQGKGTRQVTVEVGKTYLFILTDAGQRLATVTVTVKQ